MYRGVSVTQTGKNLLTRIFMCLLAWLSLVLNLTFNNPSVGEVREMRIFIDSIDSTVGVIAPGHCGLK